MNNLRIILLILSLFGGCMAAFSSQKKPNIIIIVADDLGWGDVGYLGSDIRTPHIDRLAREGLRLNRFYTTPICSPTRAGLLTGRYPDRFGLRKTVVRPWFDFGLDTTAVLLPEMLGRAGYTHRAIIGKWHLGHSRPAYHPLRRGFTYFYGHLNGAIDYFSHKREGELDWHNDFQTSYDVGYSTDLITKEAVRCIRQYDGESPFFLYVAYNAPHAPLQAQKAYLAMYEHEKDPARKKYSAMVTNMDQGIGQIMEALEKLGIEDHTLVLFHSDNGAETNAGGSTGQLNGKKLTEWEGGVRVPAIIKWPGGFNGGVMTDQVMGYIDVMPTLLAVAGIQDSAIPFDGLNLISVLKNPQEPIDRSFYLGCGAMVNRDWKLIKATHSNPRMKLTEDMLFRIASDPSETCNVREKHRAVFEHLDRIVSEYDGIVPSVPPPQDRKPKDFSAPKEWNTAEGAPSTVKNR